MREVKLENYFPSVLANAREFIELAKSENPELEKLRELLYKWFLNTFVYDLDIDGASRWECMLEIIPNIDDTLEHRRQRILAKYNSILPYTHKRLLEMLSAIYGEGKTSVYIDYDKYNLIVEIAKSLRPYAELLQVFLRSIIPANLALEIYSIYKTDGNIYLGGKVRRYKNTIINPCIAFNMLNTLNRNYFGGKVRQYKFTKVGGSE